MSEKGVRGFELDVHVTFSRPLTVAEATAALLALEGFTVELYRPHPAALVRGTEGEMPDEVPGARLTGPLRDPEAVRAGLAALLQGPARTVEVGQRGFLRSADGRTEWMPWRRNVVKSRQDTAALTFEEGVRTVLE